jgi:hypothetical protein
MKASMSALPVSSMLMCVCMDGLICSIDVVWMSGWFGFGFVFLFVFLCLCWNELIFDLI